MPTRKPVHALTLHDVLSRLTFSRVELTGSMDDLKRRLELLLGAKPEMPVQAPEPAVEPAVARKQRIAEAGGQLVAAAIRLLGELVGPETPTGTALRSQLTDAVDVDPAGRPILALTLPDHSALDDIARVLGGLFARVSNPPAVVN